MIIMLPASSPCSPLLHCTHSGLVDASLVLEGSAVAPYLGGRLSFSRGTLSLLPPAPPPSAPAAAAQATAANASTGDEPAAAAAAAAGSSERPMGPDAQLVASAFSLLKAGRKRAILSSTAAAARHALHPAARAASAAQQAAMDALGGAAGPGPELQLSGLEVVLGPEFKAQFPVVLSASLAGQVGRQASIVRGSERGGVLVQNAVAVKSSSGREVKFQLMQGSDSSQCYCPLLMPVIYGAYLAFE